MNWRLHSQGSRHHGKWTGSAILNNNIKRKFKLWTVECAHAHLCLLPKTVTVRLILPKQKTGDLFPEAPQQSQSKVDKWRSPIIAKQKFVYFFLSILTLTSWQVPLSYSQACNQLFRVHLEINRQPRITKESIWQKDIKTNKW